MIEIPLETYREFLSAEICIMDISGRLIHQTVLTRNTYLWETGEIEKGIYLIRVRLGEELIITEKIVIQH